MSGEEKPTSIADIATIRLVQTDDLADVRHVHAQSFRALACDAHTEEEIEAFVALVYNPDYTDDIANTSCLGMWVDNSLVATCSWAPADDGQSTARIANLFVSPLFSRLGIGQLLLAKTEAQAAEAGFDRFSVRVSVNAVPFFEHLGYTTTSHGARPLTEDISLPVVFMRKGGFTLH